MARLMGYMVGTATLNMVILADMVGLFKHMADRPAETTQEIADGMGLNERWIRELLHQLVRFCQNLAFAACVCKTCITA